MTTFFQTLPRDAHRIIIRKISNYPSSELWTGYLKERSVGLILDDRSPLKSAVPEYHELFSKVDINGTVKTDYLRLSGIQAESLNAFQKAGHNCEHLRISDLPSGKVPRSVYEELLLYSTGLKSIDLKVDGSTLPQIPLRQLIKKNARSLESVKIVFRGQCEFFFDCNLESLPKLTSLHLCSRQLENLVDIFKLCGTTLRELNLNGEPNTDWLAVISPVRKLCPHLQDISFTGRDLPSDEYSNLLKSYSSQLRKAKLGRISPGVCNEILLQCPNIASTMHLNLWSISRFRVLASNVDKVIVFHDINLANHLDFPNHRDQLYDYFRRCENISEAIFDVHMDDQRVLESFFAHDKPSLRELRINRKKSRFSLSTEVIEGMKRAIHDLRIMKLNVCMYENETLNSLCDLLEKCDKLETVHLEHDNAFDEDQASNYTENLLEVFAKLPNLKEVRVIFDLFPYDSKVFETRIASSVRNFAFKREIVIEFCRKVHLG